MLSDTRVVVSDFIVKVKSFGRKSVDTTTVFLKTPLNSLLS